jgi:hypothetical protein
MWPAVQPVSRDPSRRCRFEPTRSAPLTSDPPFPLASKQP